jgi:tubulin polyglutamylase TTLL6/13
MICKPDHEAQGRGIFLTNDIEQLQLVEPMIVQEYVNDPFLIDGLKFDLRIYVLVVSSDPMKIFMH